MSEAKPAWKDAFADKVAVITGGASGIGKALAVKLAQAGARVIIADIKAETLEQTQQELAQQGLEVDGRQVDLTNTSSVLGLADSIFADFGTVHLLFNNAGVGVKEAKRRIWDIPEQDWHWAYAVNVMGVVNGIRAFVPRMLEKGEPGHVINTSSGNGGIASLPTTPVYASSKAAVTSLTEVLHYQLLTDGAKLQAHVMFPGPHLVNTDILNSHTARPESYRVAGEQPPAYVDMKALAESAGISFKLTQPEEVAEMTLDGVVAGQFWILSKAGSSDASLKSRTENILSRENPELPKKPT